jgi:ribosomal protein L20A (L18A)
VLFQKPKTAGGCWDREVHLAEHKIIIRQIGVEPTATLLLEKIAVTGNIFTIRAKNNNVEFEKFILAIINSKLIKYFWQIMFADFKNSFPQVTIESLSQIPIKQQELESDVVKALCAFANKMMEIKELLLVAKTDNEKEYLEKKCKGLDRQIDALVYELYGLTEEEIKIVEG